MTIQKTVLPSPLVLQAECFLKAEQQVDQSAIERIGFCRSARTSNSRAYIVKIRNVFYPHLYKYAFTA